MFAFWFASGGAANPALGRVPIATPGVHSHPLARKVVAGDDVVEYTITAVEIKKGREGCDRVRVAGGGVMSQHRRRRDGYSPLCWRQTTWWAGRGRTSRHQCSTRVSCTSAFPCEHSTQATSRCSGRTVAAQRRAARSQSRSAADNRRRPPRCRSMPRHKRQYRCCQTLKASGVGGTAAIHSEPRRYTRGIHAGAMGAARRPTRRDIGTRCGCRGRTAAEQKSRLAADKIRPTTEKDTTNNKTRRRRRRSRYLGCMPLPSGTGPWRFAVVVWRKSTCRSFNRLSCTARAPRRRGGLCGLALRWDPNSRNGSCWAGGGRASTRQFVVFVVKNNKVKLIDIFKPRGGSTKRTIRSR